MPEVEENPSAPSCNPLQQSHNLKLYPMPQPSRSGKTPHGPNTIPSSTNLFGTRADWPIPPTQMPTVNVEKAESSTQGSCDPPMLRFYPNHRIIGWWKKNVHGVHTVPFAKRKKKKVQKIGKVLDRKINRGTTNHKILSTPNL